MLDDALVPGKTCRKYLHEYVSILVVLDDALVLPGENIEKHACNIVSILVVLDDALVHKLLLDEIQAEGLNPCCAGRCSSTKMMAIIKAANKVSQSLLCWTML